jgi:hemerythrin
MDDNVRGAPRLSYFPGMYRWGTLRVRQGDDRGLSMSIRWTPDLTVGIAEVDRDQQAMFGAVASLLEAMREGSGKAEIGRFLEFMQRHLERHFALEEHYMRECGYPHLGDHKGEHDQFAAAFARLFTEYQTGGATTALVLQANKLAVHWLRAHIGGADRRFGAFWHGRTRVGARPIILEASPRPA